jgi:carboxyl-terminal processing protease
MENWQKAAIAAMLGLVVALVSFGVGYQVAGGELRIFGVGGGNETSDIIVEAYEDIVSTSLDPASEEKLREAAIRAMVEVQKKRDPYADFYDPESYEGLQELTEGSFSGIGVTLRPDGKGLQVMRVLPKSPAQDEGLRAGDVITKVGGRAVTAKNMQRTIDSIKGRAGTEVAVTVQRGDREIRFRITRAEIEYPSVTSRLTKRNHAYIRVSTFAEGAARQARKHVDRLVERGAEGIILDLRGNTGGLFSEGLGLSSLFIEDGTVAIQKSSSGDEEVFEASGDAFEDITMVVLVDGGSASASEIVAGALKDRDRAQLVGTRTFGKAAVQQVQPLPDGSAVKLTVATYLTPSRHDVGGRGIQPDVVVENPRAQLERAERLLEAELAAAGEQG